jgi:uncharacterized protein (UPF0332 family)
LADIQRRHGTPGGCVDRAYFAMFDAAKAMALAEGTDYPPRANWLEAFADRYVKSGRVDAELFADLCEAHRLRHAAVYGPTEERGISRAVAESTLGKALRFAATAEHLVQTAIPEGEGIAALAAALLSVREEPVCPGDFIGAVSLSHSKREDSGSEAGRPQVFA